MKKLSRLYNLIIILLFATALAGCGSKASIDEISIESPAEGYVYYVNKDDTCIEKQDYEPLGSDDINKSVEYYLGALKALPEDRSLRTTLGVDTSIKSYQINGNQLILDFDSSYKSLSHNKEVLFRAAVVRTMCQVEGIDSVLFTVESEALADSQGMPYGGMMAENFVDNTGNEINTYERAELTLYFANLTGDKLVKQKRTVVYSSNISMEKLIMEQLLQGPDGTELRPVISSERRINSVTTKDGICYVNLTEPAVDFTGMVNEEVSVYAIVNSLSEINGVNKVQISIDGETDRTFRGGFDLNQTYERNLDLVE